MIYLDNAGTTKVSDKVLKEIQPYFNEIYGNASSLHTAGQIAKEHLESAREDVAKCLNAKAEEIYFTSGGSESDNWALTSTAKYGALKGKKHIITSAIEHHAILHTLDELKKQGFEVTYLPVYENGIVKIEDLKNAIRPDTILVTIMFANNEIGTIQPIKEIGQIAKEHNVYFHTDSVQAIGNLKIDVNQMNIDSLSMSAHKFYGPKGVGALYVRDGVPFEKLQDGGHQEKDKRAGTENTAGIVGLGKAIELAYKNIDSYNEKLLDLREFYFSRIKQEFSEVKINGHRNKRLPGNANVSFKGVNGGDLLLRLDEMGICASTGSACNSASAEPSHVLVAIGVEPEYLQGSLRTTFGEKTHRDDINYLVTCLKKIIKECK